MEGTAPRGRQRVTRFVDADQREAVGALVAIIRDQRPHVVITYDPKGGYGHPDHVHAHVVTTAAVAAAGSGEYPGEPWTVPKFYWTVLARSAFKTAYDGLDGADVLPEWTVPQLEDIPFGYADEDIDAVVETGPDAHAAKVAALAAHATQVAVGPTGRVCAVSNNFAMPILGDEHYVLVGGSPGERDERGWETDLLAGLGFDGAAKR
jgi:N-acetyl-1-D-myo-inositol-2-amino-2-deoxy-alpha-D-glucopyranoside deacetylase